MIQKTKSVTIRLHWLIAALMIALLAVGMYMAETEAWALYPWHKSFGIVVLPLALARIVAYERRLA